MFSTCALTLACSETRLLAPANWKLVTEPTEFTRKCSLSSKRNGVKDHFSTQQEVNLEPKELLNSGSLKRIEV